MPATMRIEPDRPRKLVITASASGNGKTTLGRELAARLEVPFVEMDSLVHGPGWTEASDEELRARVEPILALSAWVIDGTYEHKLGNLVLDASDLMIWLDLPVRIWFPRLLRRTARRIRHNEELWNGNRESWRTAICGWNALIPYALRSHVRRRRTWAAELSGRPVIRVRTEAQVTQLLDALAPPGAPARASD